MDTIWDSKIRRCGALIGGLTGLAFARTDPVVQRAATPTGGENSISASTASERYQDFLDWLAGNLDGTDTTALDGTIRTTLKQIVDERRVAGEISANAADAFKQQLDVTDVPLLHVPLRSRASWWGYRLPTMRKRASWSARGSSLGTRLSRSSSGPWSSR